MQPGRLVVLSLMIASVFASACGDGDDAAAPNNEDPDAVFIAACRGLTCTFTESSRDPDGNIASWSWDFGDQGTSTDPNPAHVYASVGSFTVTLTVTDNDGATATETATVTTSPPTETTVNVTLEAQAGFKATLTNAITCEAHGNTFRITTPVADVLTTDGCYDTIGKEIVHAGPYPAGTQITAQILAPPLSGPPDVRVQGAYPQWTIEFEDGVDTDYDDLIITLTALP